MFPSALWGEAGNNTQVLYFTFDDGPTPEITDFVLKQLEIFHAKATFFCIGKNVIKNPEIFKNILAQGHSVGNHTFSHFNGWKTPLKRYLSDINACEKVFSSKLFRPPYGRLTPAQYLKIKERYRPVFWNLLSLDFDVNKTPEECYLEVIEKARNGDIVVFHDSVKAFDRLEVILPQLLQYYTQKGFVFKSLELND